MRDIQVIKDFYGRKIGSIETDEQGNKLVKDFYGRLQGKYDKKLNVTKDFYGRVIARGDQSSALLTLGK